MKHSLDNYHPVDVEWEKIPWSWVSSSLLASMSLVRFVLVCSNKFLKKPVKKYQSTLANGNQKSISIICVIMCTCELYAESVADNTELDSKLRLQ
jgi:hypothetical protein